MKNKFGYDDSLDAFGVHGVGGTLGAILTGVFATNAVNNALKDGAGNPLPLGLVDGNGAADHESDDRLGDRDRRSAVVGYVHHPEDLSTSSSAFVLTARKRQMGLDLSMHGEEGYNFEA